jgi:hypothetical protein
MDKNSDDVLAELKLVGAVGRPQKALVPVVVEVEKVVSEGVVPFVRGRGSAEALDVVIEGLDEAMRGLERAREALVHLRRSQRTEELPETPPVAPEPPMNASERVEVAPMPSEPQKSSQSAQRPAILSPEDIAHARELARRKILGEDLPPEQRAMLEEEDDAPFVGQVRAHLPGQEPEEITIGTVGTIKPSFPVEE